MQDPRIRLKWQRTNPLWVADYNVVVPLKTLPPYPPELLERSPTVQIMRVMPFTRQGKFWEWSASAVHMLLPPGTGRGVNDTPLEAALAAEAAWFEWWGDRPVPVEWLRDLEKGFAPPGGQRGEGLS